MRAGSLEALWVTRPEAVDLDNIKELSDKVMGSGSYDEAISHIEEYFPVDCGDL